MTITTPLSHFFCRKRLFFSSYQIIDGYWKSTNQLYNLCTFEHV